MIRITYEQYCWKVTFWIFQGKVAKQHTFKFNSLYSIYSRPIILANANLRSRSLFAVARPSVVGLSVVCNVRAPYHGDPFKGTPPPGELNTTRVAKYSDFGPIDGYISETVQGRRQVSVNH